MTINLNGRQFKSLKTDLNGEVSNDTTFHYAQDGHLIWAEYQGGAIQKGFLVGKMTNQNEMIFNYQHINEDQELMTGKCKTQISENMEGKIMLEEQWEWTCNDHSKGQSTLLEI